MPRHSTRVVGGPWIIRITRNGQLITDGVFNARDGDRTVKVVSVAQIDQISRALRDIQRDTTDPTARRRASLALDLLAGHEGG